MSEHRRAALSTAGIDLPSKRGALGGVPQAEAVTPKTVGARTKIVSGGSGWLLCADEKV